MAFTGLFTVNCLSHVLVNPKLLIAPALSASLISTLSLASRRLWLLALFHCCNLYGVAAVFKYALPPPSSISAGASWWWESSAKGHRCTIAGRVLVNLFRALHLLPQRRSKFWGISPSISSRYWGTNPPPPSPQVSPDWLESRPMRSPNPLVCSPSATGSIAKTEKAISCWTPRPKLSAHLRRKPLEGWTLQKFCISSSFRYQALIQWFGQKAPISIFYPLCGYFISESSSWLSVCCLK